MKEPRTGSVSQKPLQRISWSAKIADDYKFFKDTADYYIGRSRTFTLKNDIQEQYRIYNNEFDKKYFKHIMDPLSAKKDVHKNFQARMRPTGILRTNLDLLMGEYPRRPFSYQVTNMGDSGYNAYTESLSKAIQSNLTQHFIAMVQQEAIKAGVPVNEVPHPDQIPLPEALQKQFKGTYKDNIAVKGQKWLERAMEEFHIRQEQFKMFKDWLISGWCHSYKGVEHNKLRYERASTTELFFDEFDGNEYLEDKEWIVRKRRRNLSDIIDTHYDELTNKMLSDIEEGYTDTPDAMYNYFRTVDQIGTSDMINEYHVVWKGKMKMFRLYYPDPLTGEIQMKEVDGDYKANKDAGEVTEEFWANQWYETTRLGKNTYLRTRAIPIQRNEMDSASECKGPYNGRAFSNTNANNISVLSIGLPFQLMHMIIQYILEKTIAKSKGKIFLIDRNTIPRDKGWDDEKFFWYADALGYALIDRNQDGVDKSMNQYAVVDMTLYDSIAQLIVMQNQVKQQWDDILGITRQRKGQTYASDSVTNNQEARFQSTVITDCIFSGFEEFIIREFQGILDLSKFTNINGVRKIYNNDDYTIETLEIDPEEYTNANLGIYFKSSSKEQEHFEEFRNQMQALIQNGTKPSVVLDIIMTTSLAELKMKLKQVEEIESQLLDQQQKDQYQADQDKQQQQAQQMMQHEQFINQLKSQLLNLEWDRKDANTVLAAEVAVPTGGMSVGPDAEAPIQVDPNDVAKRVNETMKLLSEDRRSREQQNMENQRQNKELMFKYDELNAKERMNKDNNKTALKNKVAGESKKK